MYKISTRDVTLRHHDPSVMDQEDKRVTFRQIKQGRDQEWKTRPKTVVLNNPTSNLGKYSYFTRINNGGMV